MDWTLFGSALLSSTLLPGGSEALLLYRLHQGADPLASVAAATAGNVLGSLITYGMGRFGRRAVQQHSEKAEQHVARAGRWFARFGRPALLLAWLPVIGDPLCLVAGVLRVSVASFLLLVTAGKLARYAALAWLM
ncbi:MAG: YqaA family protein [Thiobacillus sp.]|jgi:membrane protein YqaA with SNARE-associated domain|uniref:YqaA family protein n=1 Tax=Thiobacillus sp. TaxID=924 RepID=UPI002893C1B7|nr:YqaA family protein [Thiobacillus sp.]MDT3705584.1 YqaA family protein [Thiobacillus sp.]